MKLIQFVGLVTLFIIIGYLVFEFSKTRSRKPFVTIKKTICFGACPIYEATIFDDGTVWYDGEEHVKYIGHKKFNLSEGDILDIQNAINTSNFFELEDEYDGEVTDLPSTYLTVSINGNTKKIRVRYDVPKKLDILIDIIHRKITNKL